MSTARSASRVLTATPTTDGAGVRLKRVFGYHQARLLDPFLLLDHFGSSDPDDYLAGFPWHPHRGIETVTYMIRGEVEHGDSIGNRGVIGSGDVQWMTAGRGIVHQEMPRRFEGTTMGTQLWVNLPSSQKMMRPRYRGITSSMIPEAAPCRGATVKVIAGTVGATTGPASDLIVPCEYLDVSLEPDVEFEHAVARANTAFAYLLDGDAVFGPDGGIGAKMGNLVLFDNTGDSIVVSSGKRGARLLLASGPPLREPIAWRGPIVMNTEQELDRAFDEIADGTFTSGQ
jgi:quercetin 2,3-dioxygenase